MRPLLLALYAAIAGMSGIGSPAHALGTGIAANATTVPLAADNVVTDNMTDPGNVGPEPATTPDNSVAPDSSKSDLLSPYSAPFWIVLILNIATLAAAGVSAFAALKTNPETALKVADKQADVSRAAVEVAAQSALAAHEAASASTLNAKAAELSARNQGVHAVARLRQEWINELRGRVAQANAMLSNPQLDTDRRRELNEIITRIKLLLNPTEDASKVLLAAIERFEASPDDWPTRQKHSAELIECAQSVLKTEWDRVRSELMG